LALTSGCVGTISKSTVEPIKRQTAIEYVQEKLGSTVRDYQKSNTPLVAVISDNHASIACQAKLFQTLRKLDPRTKFIAAEGAYDEVTIKFWEAHKEANAFSKLTLEQRVAVSDRWIKEYSIPLFRSSYGPRPLPAAIINELTYQEKVLTLGIEDKDLFFETMKTYKMTQIYNQFLIKHSRNLNKNNLKKTIDLAAPIYDLLIAEKKKLNRLIVEREPAFVKKLKIYLEKYKTNKGDIIPLIAGVNHGQNIVSYLNLEGISNVTIDYPECQ